MALELEYIEETQQYNISGKLYSHDEMETITHFFTSNEFDLFVQRNPEYTEIGGSNNAQG